MSQAAASRLTNVVEDYSTSRTKQIEPIDNFLTKGVDEGVFPGCVLVVGVGGELVYRNCFGNRAFSSSEQEHHGLMTRDTVFDVASITQGVITTTLIMKLVESGKLQLQDRVTRYVQGFGVFQKSSITIRQLLSHSSGLAHWHPFHEELMRADTGAHLGIMNSRGAREYVFNAITRAHLKYSPDSRQLYSDLGFIVLGKIIRTLTGLSIAKAAQKYIMQPLGLKSSSYIDLAQMKQRGLAPVKELIAPTEDCTWRKRVLCGEVHEDNAWAMGGVSGHSGLFATAEDLHVICCELLASYHGQSNFVPQRLVQHHWSPVEELEELSGNSSWRIGWDSPSKENGMLGSGLSEHAIGINGFTGCSVWVEPKQGIDIVFMSNRINPSRSNKKIQAFRPDLVKVILESIS